MNEIVHQVIFYFQFFQKYAIPPGKLKAKHLYTGYMDDMSNTDNAWIECEIWHFHYEHADNIDSKLPQVHMY